MIPTKAEAEKLLASSEIICPGGWAEHSRVAARCAQRIASCCAMEEEKAYVLGLLHDIGRLFGPSQLRHVIDGRRFLTALGYDEAARVCLTHSFQTGKLGEYIGAVDVPAETLSWAERELKASPYDDYDRLIQLCDSLALPSGPVTVETRMADVARRYGYYPEEKRRKNQWLVTYFERRMGRGLYETVCAAGREAGTVKNPQEP